jgi:hypothetical protein
MDASLKVAELPAMRGAAWLAESFRLFRGAPLAWMGIVAGWVVMLFGALIVPLLGPVLVNLLQPVFFASFAVAAYRQAHGERVSMGDLFLGFKRSVRALLNLGMVNAFLQIGIFFVMSALGLPTWPADRDFDLREYMGMVQQYSLTLWVGFALMLVVSGALWFAPQLIAFHGMTASHAIRWSAYAALANFGALVLYGLVLFVVLFIAWIPFGLGLLAAVPVFVISTYVGYREVFEAKAVPAAPAE